MAETTTITVSSLLDEAKLISSFEGREQKDAKGQSLYDRIHIQSRDEALLTQYAMEAALDINKCLVNYGEAELSDSSFAWTWKNSYYVSPAIPGLVERYILNWIMAAWLEDKVPTRAEYYTKMRDRLATGIRSLVFKHKPTMI